jgi:hypothetical protein
MVVCGFNSYKIHLIDNKVLLEIDNNKGRNLTKDIKIPHGCETLKISGLDMKVVLFSLSEQERMLLNGSDVINILVFKNNKWSGFYLSELIREQKLLEFKVDC